MLYKVRLGVVLVNVKPEYLSDFRCCPVNALSGTRIGSGLNSGWPAGVVRSNSWCLRLLAAGVLAGVSFPASEGKLVELFGRLQTTDGPSSSYKSEIAWENRDVLLDFWIVHDNIPSAGEVVIVP